MSEVKSDRVYSKDHEWVLKTDQAKIVRVGITDFAQNSLGDVTFLDLPPVGKQYRAGEIFGSVESVKAVSDLFMPVSGTVRQINTALVDDPSPINSDPYNSAWMLELEMSDENELNNLMVAQAYQAIAV